jgi:hypothetical protein
MRRAAIERPRTVRTWREHQLFNRRDGSNCRCDVQVGRFRKGQRRLGCGKPRCYLCHPEKLFGEPKLADLRGLDRLRDGLRVLVEAEAFPDD